MRQQQTIHSAQHPLNNEQFLRFPCPCSICHYPREVPAQRVRQGNRQLRFTTSGIKLQGVGNLKRLTAGTTKTSHSQNILLRVTDKSKTHWTVYFLRCFYLRAIYEDGQCDIGFVLGKAQLTPIGETTIPKFELYAAMLTVERSDLKPDVVYCNNKVVLGYIYTLKTDNFVWVYTIGFKELVSLPSLNSCIMCQQNITLLTILQGLFFASLLINVMWLSGSDLFYQPPRCHPATPATFELISPDSWFVQFSTL